MANSITSTYGGKAWADRQTTFTIESDFSYHVAIDYSETLNLTVIFRNLAVTRLSFSSFLCHLHIGCHFNPLPLGDRWGRRDTRTSTPAMKSFEARWPCRDLSVVRTGSGG